MTEKNFMSQLLKIEKKQQVVFLTLNRPKKRNALNPPLIKSLLDFFEKPGWDSNTKALLLCGAGPAFCSGADLKWLTDSQAFNKKTVRSAVFAPASDRKLPFTRCCPYPRFCSGRGLRFTVGGGCGDSRKKQLFSF